MSKKIRELSMEEVKKVAGGSAADYMARESEENCYGDVAYGPHQWVRTGKHEEKPFLFFWTKGFDEFKCSKCGKTKWEH